MTPNPSTGKPATYEIQVQGRLDESWSNWFNGMAITPEGTSGDSPVTTLTGVVADQAALRGILERIWNLNLTLVSVNRLGTRDQGSGSSDQGSAIRKNPGH